MLLVNHPLVHLETNMVTVNDAVNIVLAAGGTAICANAKEEAEEITSLADGLVLNLGTPSKERAEAMLLSGKKANALGIPVVLDPVGAGASAFRDGILSDLLRDVHFTCIRGNASEIAAMCRVSFRSQGVEDAGARASLEQIQKLSEKTGAVIAVTGEKNLVVFRDLIRQLPGGSPLQKRITGSGCMLSSLLGAFLADRKERNAYTTFLAVCGCIETYCRAARRAASRTRGAGTASFRSALIDDISCTRIPVSAFHLYAVTDRSWLNGRTLEEVTREALEGGASLVQLREKHLSGEALVLEAKSLTALCHRFGIPLLVDDDVEAARLGGADGVHVGQSDMAVEKAREILGEDAVIGATAHNTEEAVLAEKAGADYLGCGAAFGSATKKDAKPIDRNEYRSITAKVSIPVAAIGGIDAGSIEELSGMGLSGAAVISGIFAQQDIREASRKLAWLGGQL